MKKIKEKIFLLFWVACLPFSGNSQNHLVNQGGQLVTSGGLIILQNSRLTNNGTITATNGTIKIIGNATDVNSAIGGTSASTFNNLTIAKTANNVPLAQNITVNGTLRLEEGHIDLKDFDLNLLNTVDAISGATPSHYIKTSGNGQLKMNVGATEKTFPVGNSSFNPVKIANTGTADFIGVRVEDQILDNLNSGNAIVDASVNRVWHLTEQTVGSSNLNINVQWNQGEELPNFDRSQSTFAAFEGGEWVGKNTGAATGGDPFTFSGTNITALGAFSVASIVCQLNGAAALGIAPPVAGIDQLDICGTNANLSAISSVGSTGTWSFAADAPNGSGSLGNSANIASSLTGVFGGVYTLRWTVNSGACATIFDELMVTFNPDEDLPGGLSDGVQDCLDICLGGDDLVNTDGFGAPDDCDCLPNDGINEFVEFDSPDLLSFVGDINLLGLDTAKRSAEFQLTSMAEVEAKVLGTYPTIIFRAGNNIILEPGFHAKAGSDFLAEIENCRDPITGQINPLAGEPEKASTQRSKEIKPIELNISKDINLQIHPNIVNYEAAIIIDLPSNQVISLNLYNQNGQRIRNLIKKEQRGGGQYYFKLNVSQLGSGFYLLQLQGEGEVLTRKFLVLE